MKRRDYINFKIRELNFNWISLSIVLFVFLFNNKTIAQTTPEIITTTGAGSWTSPVGITSFTVEVWGGGGAGGGCPANTRRRGGSGGTGGTYVRNTYTPGTPTLYNYLVGASQVGTNNANGANGNFSWFSAVGTQYATGGLGGKVGNGAAVAGSSAGSIGTTIIAGGNTLAGVGGAGSTIGSAGSAGANGGGAGGGTNTATNTSGSIAGFNGVTPGGGGGGASTQLNNGTFPDVPGGTGERGEIRITYLHINSLGNTLGCQGSTITINGTDFIGATAANITIGGTAVSSIVSNTGTQIVAVVGAGTTGTVSITIAGKGTTTSSQTFTVETPVDPPNPTSDSPQCASPGVTLTRTGSVPAGETWYWQTVSGGTSTTNSGNTYVVSTSGTYYIRARNNTSLCWSTGEGSVTIVINATPGNPGNPTSNSPQCLPTGVTLTSPGTPPVGTTWYWQTVNGGTSMANSATTNVVTTSGTYYIRAQNNTTGCWSAGSGSLAVVVNALPANPGNPTSNSPQCASPGVTITRAGTVPAGETWYWQTASGGTSTTSSTATYNVITSGTYYIRSRNNTSLCWSSGEGSITVVVNPLPANPGNPTSDSPQCNPPGVTLTRTGTVPAGETWYWQTTALGTTTTSSAATYLVTSSATYYIRAQNNTTGCWSAASGSLAVVVNTVPTAAITPSPATAATGVCYSGIGAISSVSWAATAGATSYDVYFGAGSLPGSVTANVTTNSYTTGTLLGNTTYYWKVVAKNACGSAVGSATWTFTTSSTICYCTSTSTSSSVYFNAFSTTGGTTNITNNASGFSTNGYGNFTAQIATQIIGGSINFSTTIPGIAGLAGVAIFVDWNQNGVFTDPGDNVYNTSGYVSVSPTGSFTVPFGASLGTTRMRIVVNYISTSPVSCNSGMNGETEDYSFTVTAPSCYTTSVNAATNITYTTATINWNAATVVPSNGYQYIVSTSSTTPVVAGTPAAGLTANITGLTANTTYYVFVRSDCGGGNFSIWSQYSSFYTGYCVPASTNASYYIRTFVTTQGTANINNTTTYSTAGYGNFTAQVVSQVSGGSVYFTTDFSGTTDNFGFSIWVDWNDDFDFSDANELAYTSGPLTVTGATGTIAVPATATVGNHRMRIRANYGLTNPSVCGSVTFGETEDYTFTVLSPLPCAGNPTNVAVTFVSPTASTVNWTAGSPAPANGYQYFLSTTNVYPSSVTGSVAAGVTTLNLTGLTALTTYYIWVRANCGGGLGQGVWVGPTSFTQPNCTPGSGTGTTPLGCPSVTSGGFGLSGASPAPIDCTSSGCTDLEATYLPLGDTTNYTVEAIPYSDRPYQYNCLQHPISLGIDDIWSPVINLPFNFCFYGNSYSSCIVGSNGILSFNTANANAASGYAFSNNLPSTVGALFSNSIYGVYHDIDPKKGGEVGWELITLNTGCRALVASWYNVPMYSNNSILYTGMMVLYENTNVIEVFIKEKNVDNFDISPWNGGNAIVGLQNASGTAAVVAPGRNALDTNWEVANEAWRFTPSGTSIASVKWYEGSGTTGPVVGTGDILHICPPATTTYTAEVTYSLCNGTTLKKTNQTVVTVTNAKVWDGSVSTDWNVDDNWTPSGVPTALNCVVIPNVTNDPIIYGPSFNAYGLNLTILTGGNLQINSGNTLTITDFVKVDPTGSFTIHNTASLVQVNDAAVNTGNINMERTANVRNTDYVYWSSPVANFSASAISPGTSTNYIWKWHPTIANANGGEGNWVSGNETMILGKGYIVRGPNSYTSTPADYTATFTGIPFNGIVQPSISRGNRTAAMGSIVGANGITITSDSDNWNLVGNPYPSAIKALDFLSPNTNIAGTVRLWRHGLQVSSSYNSTFYATYGYNYSPTDYINYNGVGPNPPGFNGYIGSGQGFFILMNDGIAATENVTFNNSMRSNTYSNSDFFKSSSARAQTEPNKHRIWLSLLNASTVATTTLIGYTDGATYGIDRLFDSPISVGAAMSIYSLANEKTMIIQGRPTPFDPADTVPLGIKIEATGIHNIALSLVDGLFESTNQGIYLEDTLLGIIHDLRVAPYLFTADAGIYNTRFILRYTTEALGNSNPNVNLTYAFITNNLLQIQSNNPIKEITIYDITGKLLRTYKPTELRNHFETDFNFANGAYVAKIKLENGIIVGRKLLH